MKRGASVLARSEGQGREKRLVVSNVGEATAHGVRCQLLAGNEDFSHFLLGTVPHDIAAGASVPIAISQERGPFALKVVVSWTADGGEERRFFGVVVR